MKPNLTPEKAALMATLPKKTAITSFALGTLILFAFLLTGQSDDWLILGFFYTLIAIIVNFCVLVYMCFCAAAFPEHRQQILLDTAILLINIPVTVFYIYVVFEWSDIFNLY